MALSIETKSSIPQQDGIRLRNAPHLALMWAPNLLNPHKLVGNIRHPIGEIFHTRHIQYPVEMKEGVEYHVVEHRLGKRLTTVDIIEQDQFPQGIIPRLRQLFKRNFYYGHDKFFPQPFKLIDRTFVKDDSNLEEHIQKVLDKKSKL